jgi:hypothetical protein
MLVERFLQFHMSAVNRSSATRSARSAASCLCAHVLVRALLRPRLCKLSVTKLAFQPHGNQLPCPRGNGPVEAAEALGVVIAASLPAIVQALRDGSVRRRNEERAHSREEEMDSVPLEVWTAFQVIAAGGLLILAVYIINYIVSKWRK